jgi:hypothetical protein
LGSKDFIAGSRQTHASAPVQTTGRFQVATRQREIKLCLQIGWLAEITRLIHHLAIL